MSNANGYIKAPVNIAADLGYVLGTGSGDLGYNIANGNINKWAVFKPVRDNAVGWVSPRNTLAKLGFGSALPRAASIAGLISLYDSAGVNGWEYLRPRGLSQNEIYREADFCKIIGSGEQDTVNWGYNHNAPNPFGSGFSALPSTVSQSADTLYVQMRRFPPAGDWPDTDLSIYDFNQVLNPSLRMQYFGCVIKGYSGRAASVAARLFGNGSGDTIGSTRGKENLYCEVTINPTTWQTLDGYIVYPCLSNDYLGQNVSLRSGQYLYPVPGAQPVVFSVIEDYIVITVYATVQPYTSGNRYDVNWSFQVTNYNNFAITLTNIAARFRLPGKTFNDTMQAGEVEVAISDMDLDAGETKYYPGQGLSAMQSLTDFDLDRLIVGARYNNQLKTGYRTFIAPVPRL